MAKIRQGIPFYPFDADLVEALGVFPTWYLQYYYYPDRKVAEMRSATRTRGEVVAEVEQDLLRKYADPSLVVKPPELSQRGGALYSEAAVRLILSLVLDRRDVQVVDVRNGGAIPDLPADGVVEVPCVVGAHGIIPLRMGPLPETIRSLCQVVKAWETWTVEAGVTGSRRGADGDGHQSPGSLRRPGPDAPGGDAGSKSGVPAPVFLKAQSRGVAGHKVQDCRGARVHGTRSM